LQPRPYSLATPHRRRAQAPGEHERCPSARPRMFRRRAGQRRDAKWVSVQFGSAGTRR
jgi:hypothetical protein